MSWWSLKRFNIFCYDVIAINVVVVHFTSLTTKRGFRCFGFFFCSSLSVIPMAWAMESYIGCPPFIWCMKRHGVGDRPLNCAQVDRKSISLIPRQSLSNTKSHRKLQNVQHISVKWMNGTKLMCLGYLYCTASASHTVRWVHLQSILFVTLDTQHVNIHVRLEELQWTHTVLSRCTFSIPSEKRPSAWLFLAALENMIIIYHWTITMALWTEGGQQAAAPSHRNVRQSFIAIQMPKGNNHTVCGCDFSVKTSEISIGLHHMQTHTTHMDTEKRHTHKHTANGGPRTHSHFARKYFHTSVNGGSTKQQNEQQHQKVILLRW